MYQYGTGFKSTSLRNYPLEKKDCRYVLDETLIKVGPEYIWLWVAIEPKTKGILKINISKEK